MSENFADYWEDFDDEVKEFVEEPDSDYESSNYNNYDPVKLTTPYHLQQGEKAIEQLKGIVEESGWKRTLIKGNTTIYSKSGGDNDRAPILMSEHVIDGFAPQSIFAVIGMRKLWDPWYEEGSLIENLDDTTSLTYMVMRGLSGTKTRDLCLVEKIECPSDETIYFASTSVLSDKVPHVIDRVRAHVVLNGWILNTISRNPPRTRVTYVLQLKVNGWVPSVMAKKYLMKRPLVVNIIDRYLQKNGPPPVIVSSTPASRPSESESYNSDWTDHPYKVNRKSPTYEKELRDRPDITSSYQEEENKEFSLPSSSSQSTSASSPSLPSSPKRKTSRPMIYSQFPLLSKNEKPPVQNGAREILASFPASSNYEEDNELSFQKTVRRHASSQNFGEDRELSSQKTLRRQASIPLRMQSYDDEDRKFSPQNTVRPSPSREFSPQNTVRPSPSREFSPPNTVTSSPQSPIKLNPMTSMQAHVQSVPAKSSSNIKINLPPPPLVQPKITEKHRHTDTVNRAVANFKDNAKDLHGWNLYMENKGVKIYMRDVEGRSNPAIRGDYTVHVDYTASDFVSAAKNSNMRKLWDDRFYDGQDIKIFNNNEIMSRVALKGTFPISARDLAICGTIEHDPKTARITYVTTSIIDPEIPEVKKYVRANLNFTGWQIDPKFDADGNTKALDVIYIVDIDIKLDSVPSSILKSISTSTPMVIQKLDESIRSTGFPPYVFNSSPKILSENISLGNFQYDLSLVAEGDGIVEIRLSKVMYPNGYDVTITPKEVKVEALVDTLDLVRITSKTVTTNKLQIRIVKRTSQGFKASYNGTYKIKLHQKKKSTSVSPLPLDANPISYESTQPFLHSVELPEETENVKHSQYQQRSRKLSKSHQQIETIVNAVNIVDTINTVDSIDSTNITEELEFEEEFEGFDTFDKNVDNGYVPRKPKRLSFSTSPPSIINPEVLKPEEENETEVTTSLNDEATSLNDEATSLNDEATSLNGEATSLNDETEYEKYEKIIREIEEMDDKRKMEDMEEMEEMEEMEDMENFSPDPIKYSKVYNISKDIVIISENVKLNSHQAALMFLAMILAYYAGKLSL